MPSPARGPRRWRVPQPASARRPDLGLGQDEEGGGRQGDPVGDAGLGVVQMQGEGHARDAQRQRMRPREQDRQGQGAAEDRGDQQIVAEAVEAEPQGRGGRQLGIAAADDAEGEQREG